MLRFIRSSESLRRLVRHVRAPFRILTGRQPAVRTDITCAKRRFGTLDASFAVATQGLDAASLVISVGIGEDISFDLGLIRAYGLAVHAFDPTPRSLAWLRTQALPASLHVYPYGLAAIDGAMTFHPPRNPSEVSHSAIIQHSSDSAGVTCEVRRLGTIMAMIGASRIDILKIDIEGAEYDVIEDMATGRIRPRQVLVEYHHRFPGIGLAKTCESIALLRRMGYRLFDISASGEEYSFLWPSS